VVQNSSISQKGFPALFFLLNAPVQNGLYVRAIAKLAADLGIPTVAEGVETEAQRELIRKEGCTEMQGYLFSRPVPSGAIVGLLNAHSRSSQAKECLLVA
jgi:EAL domain-containing protein (putative c-di-GMP-specific phosphodiesterase class I)